MKKKILASACVMGANCRYDGGNKFSQNILDLLKKGEVILMCPELLGGLEIPRPICNIVGGNGKDVLEGNAKVIGEDGVDYTQTYISSAKKAVERAIENGVEMAYLRDKSPSCGVGRLPKEDGSYREGNGVFAQLLVDSGIEVVRVETDK